SKIQRPDDRSVLGVDDGCIRRAVAEHPDALVEGIEQDAVRIALDVDRLEHGERLRIPHRDRLAAAEAVARFRIDGGAARVGVGNLADRLERVEVEDGDPRALAAAGDVEPPPDRIGEYIVESASPS